jgi:hypothetical protein
MPEVGETKPGELRTTKQHLVPWQVVPQLPVQVAVEQVFTAQLQDS